jgi:iron complex outermembrane recepter protein
MPILQDRRARTLSALRGVLCAGTALAGSMLAWGAEAAAAPAADPATVGEVVVTGSRIARRDYVAESPIVTVTNADLKAQGAATVEDFLNQLPSVTPANANLPSNFGLPFNGTTTINLRGLGSQRNLVLMDGRRLQPSNSNGSVDINSIPKALIESVEVITGGASAAYGADAVAGVLNFKLKRNFEGLELDAQYGQTFRSDARAVDVSGTVGSNFADGRGNAVLSLGYVYREQTPTVARAFFRVTGGSTGAFLQGSVNPSAANSPSQAAVDSIFATYGFAPGRVPRGSGFGLNDNGSLFSVGPAVGYTGSADEVALVNNAYVLQQNKILLLSGSLLGGLSKYNGFARVRYDLSDSVELYSEFNFTQFEASRSSQPSVAFGAQQFVIPVTNPFIPRDLRTLLASRPNPGGTFTMNKVMGELGQKSESENNTLYQGTIGLRGPLPFGGWKWDAYASHGRLDYEQSYNDGWASIARVQTLVTAADGGRSICAGGYNPFGKTTLSDACQRYLQVRPTNLTISKQDIFEASAQGVLFKLPAGDVSMAVGADYRANRFEFRPDPTITAADIIGVSAQFPLKGSQKVKELFAELLVPILKDQPFIKSLSANLAYRYSDYNTIDRVSAYKATGDWQIVDSLRVRGGYQRAVRAPNFQELYSPAVRGFATLPGNTDPCSFDSAERRGGNAAAVRTLCLAQGVPAPIIDTYKYPVSAYAVVSLGNPNLSEEKADTYSVGLVWQSRLESPLLANLRASLDYYDIKISGAIAPVSGTISVSKCFNQDGSNPTFSATNVFCGNLYRIADTGFIEANQPYLNVGSFHLAGEDLQIDWLARLEDIGLDSVPGSLALSVLASHMDKFAVQALPGSPSQDFAGTIGSNIASLPDWKLNASLRYSAGDVSVGVRWRYVAAMDNFTVVTSPTAPLPGTRATHYFDANASWAISKDIELRGGVTNIADQKPRTIGGQVGRTDASLYDIFGRSFFVAITIRR